MKKLFAVLCAAAFALSMSSAFADPITPVDITAEATVTDDGSANHHDDTTNTTYNPELAVDADISTGWQKSGNAGDGNTWTADGVVGSDVYLQFTWDETKTVSSIVLTNEDTNYMDTYANGGYKIMYLDGEAWVEITANVEYINAPNAGDEAKEDLTIDFDDVVTSSIRFYFIKGISAGKYAPKVMEAVIYGGDAPATIVDSDNLALSGTIIVDSVGTAAGDEPTPAEYANDGDDTTRWQSDALGNNGDDAWIGVKWDEAKTIGTIVIDWEMAHPAKDGFYVEISDDGETWVSTAFTYVREETGGHHEIDTISLTDAPTTQYVRVVCHTAFVHTANGPKERPSAYEFEVYAAVAGDNGDDETSTPDGETSTPDGETSTPDGETSTPDGETSTPDGETSTPDGETSDEPSTDAPSSDAPSAEDKPEDKPEDSPNTGVESFVIWAVLLAVAAAAVVLTMKKVKA